MGSRLKGSPAFWVTAGIAIVLAAFFLLFGIGNLIHPDVGEEFLAQNTRNCIMMIVMGLAMLCGVFFRYWGSILMFICTVPFVIIFHFHPIFIGFALIVLLLGMYFFLRGRQSRRSDKDDHQASS
ncbi:MAG TPA: hypothetical protein VJ624_04195 [Thermodesulfobacteriota bacterium]|nr:hypothetical protein [Thermodesulfobacteriota bacterium]